MPKHILKDCIIVVNAVDFSDHCNSVEVNRNKDEIDFTNFGSGGRSRGAGLNDDSFVLNFFQDFDAGEVDATLNPLHENETEFLCTVKQRNAATSVTNPIWSGTVILLEYTPLSGGVGEASETSLTFPVQGKIARATS